MMEMNKYERRKRIVVAILGLALLATQVAHTHLSVQTEWAKILAEHCSVAKGRDQCDQLYQSLYEFARAKLVIGTAAVILVIALVIIILNFIRERPTPLADKLLARLGRSRE